MERSLVVCAGFSPYGFGGLKSPIFRACLAGFPIEPPYQNIHFAFSCPLVGLGTAVKESLQPDTRACHQILPARACITRLSGRGVPGFVQRTETPFGRILDLALSGLLECDGNTSTDGLQPTALSLDCPFHDTPLDFVPRDHRDYFPLPNNATVVVCSSNKECARGWPIGTCHLNI